MKSLEEYPLFIPPVYLSTKERRNWNAQEARDYKDWLLANFDQRINELVEHFEEPFGAAPSEHLLALGKKVAVVLAEAPFSEHGPTDRKLTNLGYALAADMGLLVAHYLLEAQPDKLRWETIRNAKRDLSYNLPVLKGFSTTYLDPVGGSIAESSALLNGQRGADAWKRIYEFWVARVS